MKPSIPSGPGHLLPTGFLKTSSTLCSVMFGSSWQSGGPSYVVFNLKFLCFSLSCAGESSGNNLWRRAFAVSFSDVVVDPS